jgi:hypothetical protein
MIVRLLITLISIVALPAFGWHQIEAADADIPDKLVQPAGTSSTGLQPPGYSTSEIQPPMSNGPSDGDLNEMYAPENSPAGFEPV